MRQVGFLLFIQLLASCCSCPPIDIKTKESALEVNSYMERAYDSTYFTDRTFSTYDIRISVVNKSDTLNSFWIMKCSSQDNFLISDRHSDFVPTECNGNFPTVKDIQAHDSVVFKTTIYSKSAGYSENGHSITMGFILIDAKSFSSPDDYLRIMGDQSLQTKVLWSNRLNL